VGEGVRDDQGGTAPAAGRMARWLGHAKTGRTRAILLMLASTLLFSGMHATIRFISSELHPFEVTFFRNLFGLTVVLPWFVRYGLKPLRTNRFRLHATRACLNICSMLCFFYALSVTPLAEATALTFTGPIFATALAVLILHEVVGPWRWFAILAGFAGTLVILRPGFADVGLGPLLAVASAMIWAVTLVGIKELTRTDSAVTITSYMILLLIPLALIPAVFVWEWPTLRQLGWLCLLGTLGSGGHLLMNLALKDTDTNVVMSIDFVRLVWVALIGYVVFAEIPGLYTWLGGAMICGAVYLTYRDARPRTDRSPVAARRDDTE
jgi:drug/metabolite transporter (DMT)-like permease